jgi:hypothetical protein
MIGLIVGAVVGHYVGKRVGRRVGAQAERIAAEPPPPQAVPKWDRVFTCHPDGTVD